MLKRVSELLQLVGNIIFTGNVKKPLPHILSLLSVLLCPYLLILCYASSDLIGYLLVTIDHHTPLLSLLPAKRTLLLSFNPHLDLADVLMLLLKGLLVLSGHVGKLP